MKQNRLAQETPERLRSHWFAAGLILAPLVAACGSEDATTLTDTLLEQGTMGNVALALSSLIEGDEYRFAGTINVLNAGGEITNSVKIAADGPAIQTVALAPGEYSVAVPDGYFCTFSGDEAGFAGCTFVRATPNPFAVLAGQSTPVALEVAFHFELGQDITALLQTGSGALGLKPQRDTIPRCGDGPGCGSGQLCASLDGAAPGCFAPCETAADCAGDCILVDATAPGTANAQRTSVCSAPAE